MASLAVAESLLEDGRSKNRRDSAGFGMALQEEGDTQPSPRAQVTTSALSNKSSTIAFVAIVHFDLREGPCLLCIEPPIVSTGPGRGGAEEGEGENLSAEDARSLKGLLPFKALPENALATTKITAKHSDNAKGAQTAEDAHEDMDMGHSSSMFMLTIAGEVFYCASHFLRLEDKRSPRGFAQAAVACASRLPYFGVMLQRLHAFRTELLHKEDCRPQLQSFYHSLEGIRYNELGYSLIYQGLPVAAMLQQFGTKMLSILKLLLLEGRVLIESKSSAAVSRAVIAICALLPGSLALGFGHDSPAYGVKSYRWKKYGFPLQIFRCDVPMEPVLVIAEAVNVLSKAGYLAGTTNSMIKSLPNAAPDALVLLDTGKIKCSKTAKAKAAFSLGDIDRTFIHTLTKASRSHTASDGAGDGSEEHVGWEGSNGWIADQFQAHFEGIAARAADARDREWVEAAEAAAAAASSSMALQQQRTSSSASSLTTSWEGLKSSATQWMMQSVGAGNMQHVEDMVQKTDSWLKKASQGLKIGGASDDIASALECYGYKWADLWLQTHNFTVWAQSHSLSVTQVGSNVKDDVASETSEASCALAVVTEDGPHPTIIYPSKDEYSGEVNEAGERHGTGIYKERATGNAYEGEWAHDKRHGKGVLTSGGKDFIYDGEWVNDCRCGHGDALLRGKETYSGGWKDNKFHGKGVLVDADGGVYEGEFVKGEKEGMGKYEAAKASDEDASSVSYRGEWKNGLRDGMGQSVEKDGSIYSGSWAADKYHGEGVLLELSGERYEGLFFKGKKHGLGSQRTAAGDEVEGEWVDGKQRQDVEWRIRYADGAGEYYGQVEGLLPEGEGIHKYTSGQLQVYSGSWHKGQRHGYGNAIYTNGESFEGQWFEGQISFGGKGKLTMSDGTTHDYG
ncbi:unnamed protein product [Chrysoparadoxa australica]